MELPIHNFTALATDLYEVTMACGYWKACVSDYEAAFHVTFRENPFGGQFTVACGLATAIDFLRTFHFTESEIAYLAAQCGNDAAARVTAFITPRAPERAEPPPLTTAALSQTDITARSEFSVPPPMSSPIRYPSSKVC